MPAILSLRIEPRYQAVFDLPPEAPAERGFRLAEQHFSKGQLDSATLLLEFAPGANFDADELSPKIAAAVATIERAAAAARMLAASYAPDVLLAGPTAYILNMRTIADADQRRVIILATAVIAVIVLAIVRDVPLTLFMVLATWLTYGATLTLSDLFCVYVLGLAGLDWKVRLILFVIVMAVGQDYNIFLVTRLRAESRHQEARPATQAAIVRTGPVISNCGLIMAATLGSLCAGGLALLRELGLALALGILIDTFFVRPLLIPAFFLVFRRSPAPAGLHSPVRL